MVKREAIYIFFYAAVTALCPLYSQTAKKAQDATKVKMPGEVTPSASVSVADPASSDAIIRPGMPSRERSSVMDPGRTPVPATPPPRKSPTSIPPAPAKPHREQNPSREVTDQKVEIAAPIRKGYTSPSVITRDIIKQVKAFETQDQMEFSNVLTLASRLEILMRNSAEWEKNETPDKNQGKFDRIKSRAQRFGVERTTRKNMEIEVRALLDLIYKIREKRNETAKKKAEAEELAALIEKKQKERLRELQLQANLMTYEDESEKPMTPQPRKVVAKSSLTTEFYEVKIDESLKEISARKEIYGDSNQWMRIWRENLLKVPNQNQTVPAGTVLKIPRTRNARSDLENFK